MVQPQKIPPVSFALGLEQVTDAQLRKFAELIYKKAGIRISPQKKTLLSNRLRRRLKATGIPTFEAYYEHLRKLPADDPEWDGFLQEITTHETYLFRDESHWQWFRKEYLPQLAAEARTGKRPRQLRIWSAACSTGDEPVTIACCIVASLPNYTQWKIEILGTDIGIGALQEAEAAVFGERSMRLVPEEFRRRFFMQLPNARLWKAKPIITSLITYKQHNLLEPLRHLPFDLVVLKNVLIYFDRASKEVVLNNIRNVLKPGGYLLTGAAEGVADLLKDFEKVQPWLYKKASQPQETGLRKNFASSPLNPTRE